MNVTKERHIRGLSRNIQTKHLQNRCFRCKLGPSVITIISVFTFTCLGRGRLFISVIDVNTAKNLNVHNSGKYFGDIFHDYSANNIRLLGFCRLRFLRFIWNSACSRNAYDFHGRLLINLLVVTISCLVLSYLLASFAVLRHELWRWCKVGSLPYNTLSSLADLLIACYGYMLVIALVHNTDSSHFILAMLNTRDSFHLHGLPLITAWVSNYINYKMWDEITYPFQAFNGVTIGVWE